MTEGELKRVKARLIKQYEFNCPYCSMFYETTTRPALIEECSVCGREFLVEASDE